jgi:hypothetical protein
VTETEFGKMGSDPSRDGIRFHVRSFSQRRGSDPIFPNSVSVTQFLKTTVSRIRLFVVLCLPFKQVRVLSTVDYKFIMRSAFDDPAAFEEIDVIRHFDCR